MLDDSSGQTNNATSNNAASGNAAAGNTISSHAVASNANSSDVAARRPASNRPPLNIPSPEEFDLGPEDVDLEPEDVDLEPEEIDLRFYMTAWGQVSMLPVTEGDPPYFGTPGGVEYGAAPADSFVEEAFSERNLLDRLDAASVERWAEGQPANSVQRAEAAQLEEAAQRVEWLAYGEQQRQQQAEERRSQLQPLTALTAAMARRLLATSPDWSVQEQVHLDYASLEVVSRAGAEPLLVECRWADAHEWRGSGAVDLVLRSSPDRHLIGLLDAIDFDHIGEPFEDNARYQTSANAAGFLRDITCEVGYLDSLCDA